MPRLPLKLKIKILRFALGLMVFLWFLDLTKDWEFFFAKSLLEQNSIKNPLVSWNLLALLNEASHFRGLLYLALLLSILMSAGFLVSATSLFLAYMILCFFQINPMLYSPALPFFIWLLFALAILGSNPDAKSLHYKILYRGAWTLISLGYLISGLEKLMHSESWFRGNALEFVLSGPLSRWSQIHEFYLTLPLGLQKLLTWLVPSLEILFFPLAVFKSTRALAWWSSVILHVGILLLLWLPSVSLGMLVFSLFLIADQDKKNRPYVGISLHSLIDPA